MRRAYLRLPTSPVSTVSCPKRRDRAMLILSQRLPYAVASYSKPPIFQTQVEGDCPSRQKLTIWPSTNTFGKTAVLKTWFSRIASAPTTTPSYPAIGSIHPSSRASRAARTLSDSSQRPFTSSLATELANYSAKPRLESTTLTGRACLSTPLAGMP